MLISSRRTLLQALFVSLLFHGLLLSSVVRLFPVPVAVPATTLSAVISRDRRGDSASLENAPARRSPVESAAPSAPVSAAAAPPRIAAAHSVHAQSAETPLKSMPLESASHTPSAAAPAARAGTPAAMGSPLLSSPLAGAAHEGINGDDVRQYRLSLATAARRFKHYPDLARQRGWEGTAEVALKVSALAPMPEVVLVHSSGRGVLDEQALEMMIQAARVTSLPDGLKARDFRILLPVQFSLENDQRDQ